MKQNLNKGDLVLKLRKINELTQSVLLWAERSGAAQRCLPSTTGSPSVAPSVQKSSCGVSASEVAKSSITGKDGAPGVDNLVIRLPVSVPDALVDILAVHARFEHLDEIFRMVSHEPDNNPFHKAAKEMWIAIDATVKRIASGAPQRSGGERRKVNAAVSHAGLTAHK
jgi:hypothetical protein